MERVRFSLMDDKKDGPVSLVAKLEIDIDDNIYLMLSEENKNDFYFIVGISKEGYLLKSTNISYTLNLQLDNKGKIITKDNDDD